MTDSPRWVTWKPIRRGNRWTKLPTQLNGAPASSTNPATWTEYSKVRSAKRKGWVLGNGIGCIDLDGCILDDGTVMSWARQIIDRHRAEAILVEVSPSGRGVHIFMPMSEGRGRVIRDGRNIEVYPPNSGRFMCVTGATI